MGVQSSRQRQRQTSEVNPTYADPRAQTGLGALEQQASGASSPGMNRLEEFYGQQLGQQGGNPFLENVISSENALSEKALRDRLALIRSGGFRGGAGRDSVNQGQFITDFTAQQGANNARLRFDDYNTGADRQFQGAGGLAGLLFGQGDRQTNAANSLLAALRGSRGVATGESSSRGFGASIDDVGKAGAALAALI